MILLLSLFFVHLQGASASIPVGFPLQGDFRTGCVGFSNQAPGYIERLDFQAGAVRSRFVYFCRPGLSDPLLLRGEPGSAGHPRGRRDPLAVPPVDALDRALYDVQRG
jgi:hypothetical protein